jgi:hypothetical protein
MSATTHGRERVAVNWQAVREGLGGAEIACHESTRRAQCFATGSCPSCLFALCDEHGAEPDVHEYRCTVGVRERRGDRTVKCCACGELLTPGSSLCFGCASDDLEDRRAVTTMPEME